MCGTINVDVGSYSGESLWRPRGPTRSALPHIYQACTKLVPTVRTEKMVAAKAAPESKCSYHILKQLKVVTGKGNPVSCSKGKDCPKRHLLLKKLSDSTVRAVIDRLPGPLRIVAFANLDKTAK